MSSSSRFPRRLRTAGKGLLAGIVLAGCGGGGGGGGGTDVDATPPSIRASCPVSLDVGEEGLFGAVASDNNALSGSLSMTLDGVSYSFPTGGAKAVSPDTTHAFSLPGTYTSRVSVSDAAGNRSSDACSTEVLAPVLYSVDLSMRGFLHRDPNATASVTFRDDASGAEYSAQPDASGALSIDLPTASYTVLIDDADDTELHRTNLGGSCQVTDYDDEPIRIDLTSDLSGVVETVEADANLSGMAEQWTPEAATARVGPQLTVAVYTGPESPDDPQTVPLEPSEIENIRTYFNEHMALFEREGDICGGNPFNVQLVVAGPDPIQDYTTTVENGLRPNRNVQLIEGGVNMTAGASISTDTTAVRPVRVVDYSFIHGRFAYPRTVSNESVKYGSVQESYYQCSIRDKEGYLDPQCDYEVIFTLNDRNWNQIVSGYVARAQQQGFNPRIVPRDE